MKWEYLREEEFDAAIEKSGGLCVIPIGCLEKHGQHMPVGTDVIQATEIAKIAAEEEYAVELEKAVINGNFSEIFPHIVFVSGYAALVAACAVILFLKQMKKGAMSDEKKKESKGQGICVALGGAFEHNAFHWCRNAFRRALRTYALRYAAPREFFGACAKKRVAAFVHLSL